MSPYLLQMVALVVRLSVLVVPLPLIVAASNPSSSCPNSEIQTLIGNLVNTGEEQEKAITALSQCRNAVDLLIEELKDDSASVDIRSAIVEVLAQIGSPAVDGVSKVLNDSKSPEVARSLAIDVLSQIAQTERSNRDDIVQLLRERKDDRRESVLIQIESIRALRAIAVAQEMSPLEQISSLIKKNPEIVIGFAGAGGIATLYLLILWLKPLWLLTLIPTNLTIPKLGKIPDGALRWLKYQPRVLDQWVRARLDQSQAGFGSWESKIELNVEQRKDLIYIPIPFSVENEIKDKSFSLSKYLREDVFGKKVGLLVVGEGGTGKSRLACQIARWGAGWETALPQLVQLLPGNLMLPIPISWDLDKVEPKSQEQQPLLVAIVKQLPKDPAPVPNKELVKVLLEKQRILVLIDRFSELSKDTQKQIKKEMGQYPVNALIITSRLEYEDLRRFKTLSPRRLTGSNIVYFIETYFQQKGIFKLVKGDESTFIEAVWQDLRSMLNKEEEDATVLLVRLYLDRVVEQVSHEASWEDKSEVFSRRLVKSIPELMDAYLIRLNKTVGQDKRSDENIKRYVQVVAATCLEQNGYQSQAVPREDIIKALAALDKNDSIHQQDKEASALKCIDEYLDGKLKLLDISDSNYIKLSLDPLAEYFAALQFVSDCQTPDSDQEKEELWHEFIEKIDNSNIDGRSKDNHLSDIKGFLKAVRKCCDIPRVRRNVPRFAFDALDERIEPDAVKRDEIQQRKRVYRIIHDLQDNDPKYRKRAIEDLKEMRLYSKSAIRPLLAILEERNEPLELRQSAVEALQELDPDLTQLNSILLAILEERNEPLELRQSAVEALQELDPDLTQLNSILLAILEERDEPWKLRRAIIDFLVAFNGVNQAVETLLVKLKDDNSEAVSVRVRSVWALRRCGKPVPDLIAKIKDEKIELHELSPVPDVWVEDRVEGLHLEMVLVPGDSFLMGSPTGEGGDSERPQHNVTLQPFLIGKYPVTQAQWKAVVALPMVTRDLKADLSKFSGENRPVETVTWDDAIEFCRRLSKQTGRDYRLPTEAEWEYACRARTNTAFHFGDIWKSELANYSTDQTTDVGTFPANAFGLYDMHGNVWEWCQDHWNKSYEGAFPDGSAWIEGGDSCYRTIRGGSWDYTPWYCRSASRHNFIFHYDDSDIGFRVVCRAPYV